MAMMEPVDPRRAPITPQLALRVAVLGGIALALVLRSSTDELPVARPAS